MKLLVYDFVGRGPNEIPQVFFRKLNSMLDDCDRGLQRIQKSVAIECRGELGRSEKPRGILRWELQGISNGQRTLNCHICDIRT